MGGSPQPTYDLIVKSARALRVSPDWLYYGEGEAPIARWPTPVWPGPTTRRAKKKSSLASTDRDSFEREAEQLSKRGPS